MNSWELVNAQKLAEEYPYTFYKPSPTVISLLKPGNEVKLIFKFESEDPEAPSAERMWIELSELSGSEYIGSLDNDPAYIKDLKHGDQITFEAKHIIDTDIDDPVPSVVHKYQKRCFVTNNILYESEKIGYLYREEPDQEDDSGWRFTTGSETDEYMEDSNNISYVSLGAVLREDDSVVKLLDRNSGVAFAIDENGVFTELE